MSNERKIVSGTMLTLLLTGLLTLPFNIQPVRANGTIYIRADGSVEPDTAPISTVDNVTYTFTGNIYDSIVVERDKTVVDGAGYKVQGTGSVTGINLSGRSNVTIKNMEIEAFDWGIWLSFSSDNILSGNKIMNNDFDGIALDYSSNNTISGNNITINSKGIWLEESSNNIISGNNITTNTYHGIGLFSSLNNTLSGNNIAVHNAEGIWLYNSSGNSISGNKITNNDYGIQLYDSSNNSIYHNNFVDNNEQVFNDGSTNVWNDGYPSGGNYWSDYPNVDVKSGPNQDQPSSDGIGDTPYVIDGNNRDNYPLMYPWGSPSPPSYTLTIYSSPTGVTFTVDGVSCATPWSGTYSEGSSVGLVMPETHDGYVWSHWLEDGDHDRTKTVTVGTDVTLTGVFFLVDLNHDGIVDMRDISLAAAAFGGYPDHPRWTPIADINEDNKVDMRDIVTVARNFGKTI